MKPSPYDRRAEQHDYLTFAEVEPRIQAALRIVAVNGMTDTALQQWRFVRTFGSYNLQQRVWRIYLSNGIFIGRLKSGAISVEKPPIDKMQRELLQWFIPGNVLRAQQDGEEMNIYIDYDLTEDGVILLPKHLKTQQPVLDCLILGVVPGKFVRQASDDFELPKEV